MMTAIEELAGIIEHEKEAEIIPFLKKITKADKVALRPYLKKEFKYYSEFVRTPGTNSYGNSRWTDPKRYILSAAAFVCYQQKDFEQSTAYGIINREKLKAILPWYCPDWFTSYADELAKKDFVANYFNYNWYMELVEDGYLQPNRTLIVKVLPEYLFEQNKKAFTFVYKPENLIERPVTLSTHIWHLFDEESNLHGAERYKQFSDNSQPGRWQKALIDYSKKGLISREKLLKESITAAAKNFNQSLSNWFVDLFVLLEPTKPELLQLQPQLLNTFSQVSSKPIGIALKYFKELCAEPEFAVAQFLDHIPMVITAETKTAVSAALMILEKLAKLHPELSEQISLIICQAFIHQDNALQVRAAKLLLKFGDSASAAVRESVAAYQEALFFESRNLLTSFFDEPDEEELSAAESDPAPAEQVVLTEIDLPETFDDFVFLASQAFDQNEPWHFDLLPAAILKFQSQMSAPNILKLAPAFQRAYKLVTGDSNSSMGYLDNLLATFFIDFGQLLVRFYPKEAEPIRLMRQEFEKAEAKLKEEWSNYESRIYTIRNWNVHTNSLGYKPHKHILLNATFILERRLHLPLLSTPTHQPCWVSSLTLVERLAHYRAAKVVPGDMDFQVAVARCFIDRPDETLKLAQQSLDGEYLRLIQFLLGEEHYPQQSYQLKVVWLVAALTRNAPHVNSNWFIYSNLTDNYLTGNFSWKAEIQHYLSNEYDYQQKAYVKKPATRKVLNVTGGEKLKPEESGITKLMNRLAKKPSPLNVKSLYNYLLLDYQYLSAEHNDIKRLLYLNPNHTEVLLAFIVMKGLHNTDFFGENDKKLITYTLETLLTLNKTYAPVAHLLVATSMINNDKTVRTYAAELWIKGVTEDTIKSALLGNIIGSHEQIELAPMKRFTDLLVENMYQISPKHNAALETLLTECIANMGDKPINNTKKLLEIYTEVLSLNKSTIRNTQTINRINTWRSTNSLEKTIERLGKYMS